MNVKVVATVELENGPLSLLSSTHGEKHFLECTNSSLPTHYTVHCRALRKVSEKSVFFFLLATLGGGFARECPSEMEKSTVNKIGRSRVLAVPKSHRYGHDRVSLDDADAEIRARA